MSNVRPLGHKDDLASNDYFRRIVATVRNTRYGPSQILSKVRARPMPALLDNHPLSKMNLG